jgi:predicted PurR-regulated permease PerM
VLLVVFQPLHAWTLKRVPGHPRICAAITTLLILLIVLLPLIWLGLNAYTEFYRVMLAPGGGPRQADDAQVQAALADRLMEAAKELRNRFQDYTHVPIDNKNIEALIGRATSTVGAWLLSGVQTAIGLVVGLAIMIIALYYFLVDGPGMIRAVMYLSPLDEHYEQELLERFGQVSRTVVVATLLSALIQGSLAGIGYYFALPPEAPIFLLTALTMVTAMVPFVGVAAMWVLVCGWVYLYGVVAGKATPGDPKTAIILAIYCTIVVSGIDNVIKPFVLHGQSKLHPLLALLSILGGVQVLGPVGILVGPMLVSFLQALLDMLRKELDSFSEEGNAAMQLAAIVDAATPISAEDAAVAQAEAAAGTKAPSIAPDVHAKTAPVPAKLRGRRVPPRKRGR